ncbi:MAG: hypothetical protein CLLPBCKN_001392 [Chroococcidiopsis cubana SAG 39.79]|nr:hypothetical protein [Chroococcidiopsis cubana SAG 39.79]
MDLVNLPKHIYNSPSNRLAQSLPKLEEGDRAS